MGGKNSGRVLGSVGKKTHWEVYYFDPITKRIINETFNNMHDIIEHPGLGFLNRGLICYYSTQWRKGKSNKKGIVIKRYNKQIAKN